MKNVLFVNHSGERCGVGQYGRNVAAIIMKSNRFRICYAECDSFEDFVFDYGRFKPDAIIYNYYPCTTPWVKSELIEAMPRIKHFGIFHECALPDGMEFTIDIDPTATPSEKRFVMPRPLFNYSKPSVENPIPVIGSFGFGFGHKGFQDLPVLVEKEFDEAIIRLHMPFAHYGDDAGTTAREVALQAISRKTKPGIKIEITHDFLPTEAMLDWLNSNTINVFLYDDCYGKGPSSVIDYALSVGRPIAINKSYMFRHVVGLGRTEYKSLRQIIADGVMPSVPFKMSWSPERLLSAYERMLDTVIGE